jgi:RNA polymerase sigma-70 factor, ECF subfamily
MAASILEASSLTFSQETIDPDPALAASGDRLAFERLYRRHVDRVFSLCVRMVGDRTRAEEVTQDVFVRAWEKLHLFRGESSFSTWLHRVAVNVVLNSRKAASRRDSREEGEDGTALDRFAGAAGSPGDLMDLEAAIAGLPRGARQVFTLYDVEGYKHEEIAEMLGITTGATKAQLHRARMLLREALSR